jgi:uncharacterized repeat protein (TIGR03847 family)
VSVVPRQIFFFDPPDRFVAGTVGQPGERTFFLQATAFGRVTSVALEKIQVAALAERLEELLDEARRLGGAVPTIAPQELEDVAPLDQPIVEEFRVGTLALAWDGEDNKVVIEALAVTEAVTGDDDDADQAILSDDAEGPDVLRVRLDPAAAKAFARRAARVVAAGRPPCPFCGQPLDPEGHICPRQNGHRH